MPIPQGKATGIMPMLAFFILLLGINTCLVFCKTPAFLSQDMPVNVCFFPPWRSECSVIFYRKLIMISLSLGRL